MKYILFAIIFIWLILLTWQGCSRGMRHWQEVAWREDKRADSLQRIVDATKVRLPDMQRKSLEEAVRIYDSTFAQAEDSLNLNP